jgi:hypothetical protein
VNYTCGDALIRSRLVRLGRRRSRRQLHLPEGEDQGDTGTATDNAGNTNTDSVTNVDVDLTAPTISAALDISPDVSGWFNILYRRPDRELHLRRRPLGLASCVSAAGDPADSYTFPEGEDQGDTGTATDNAGNTNTDSVTNVDVDLTAPTISAALDISPDVSGWFNILTGAPTVNYTCGDALSGLASCVSAAGDPADSYTFPEGEDQGDTGTATDNAGNTNTDSVTNVDVGPDAPTVTVTPARAADYAGWYNAPVVFDTAGSDSTSGVSDANCSLNYNYTGPDGTGLTRSGSCTDNAGQRRQRHQHRLQFRRHEPDGHGHARQGC